MIKDVSADVLRILVDQGAVSENYLLLRSMPSKVRRLIETSVDEVENRGRNQSSCPHRFYYRVRSRYKTEDAAIREVERSFLDIAQWVVDEGSDFFHVKTRVKDTVKHMRVVEARLYFWVTSPCHEAIHQILEELSGTKAS